MKKSLPLSLNHDQAAFLLMAATDLDCSRPAYKDLNKDNLQDEVCTKLRDFCWEHHQIEQEDRERAFKQAKEIIEQWPEFKQQLLRNPICHGSNHEINSITKE